MKSNTIKINETHILVLNQDNYGQLHISDIAIDLLYMQEMGQFKELYNRDGIDYEELLSYIQNSNLINLCKALDICTNKMSLNTTYEGFRKFDFDKEKQQYQRKVKGDKKEILNKSIEAKSELFNIFYRRQILFSLKKAIQQLPENYLAHSHRDVGFKSYQFPLGSSLEVVYNSNFGYGYASYFTLTIKYKGIKITPYSSWVRYRIVDKYDIIRYTESYPIKTAPKNGSDFAKQIKNSGTINYDIENADIYWYDSFSFVKKIHSYDSQSIELWIINECEIMIKGLNKISKDENLESSVKQSMWEENDFIFQDNYEKMEYRVEKIAGAISFLDEVRTLHIFTNKVDTYIEEILKLNVIIYPQLLNVIKKLEQEIQNLDLIIEEKFGPIVKQKRDYDIKLSNIRFEFQDYDPNDAYYEFIERFPEFKDYRKIYLSVEEELTKLESKIDRYRGYNIRLQEYVGIIYEALEQYNMTHMIVKRAS